LRRSQAVQRNLPRPTVFRAPVDAAAVVSSNDPLAEADRLVQEELAQLVTHDAVAYPPVGSNIAGSTQNAIPLEVLPDEYLALARNEVDQELSASGAKERYDAFAAEFDQVWEEIQQEIKDIQQTGLSQQFAVRVLNIGLHGYCSPLTGTDRCFFSPCTNRTNDH